LVDIGTLGDSGERDPPIGEMDGGAGVWINPGTEENIRTEVAEDLLEGMAQGGGHEQMVHGTADLREIGGGSPSGSERDILRAGGECLAAPGEDGTRGEDADFEMRRERVEKSGVVQAPVWLGDRRE
jgi:hypothetical protein